jgi:hypothetical protein
MIFCSTLVIFLISRVRQITDSHYSMVVSQSLLEHHSFALDAYALPRYPPVRNSNYVEDGAIYQLELAGDHLYYYLPPGTSVLSVPYVALMKLINVSPTNADGTYNATGEAKIEASLAALLMAALAVIFFYTARLVLPLKWSVAVTFGGALGTQVYSTASRALWSDTWGIFLLGIIVWMLLAAETKRRSLPAVWLATLLAWTYFVRPTYSLHIFAISIYVFAFYRALFLKYAATGALWFAMFVAYSWHHFGQLLPNYYHANRLQFDVFWTALAGNLVSPARGVLVYVPIVFFVVYLLWRYRKCLVHEWLVRLALLICVAQLLVVSCFGHWWAGHSFGPRFMTGFVPWLVLLGALGLQAMLKAREAEGVTASARWRRVELTAGGALLLLSMTINAFGATSHATWLWNIRPLEVDDHPERLWDWKNPQFLAGILSRLPPEVSLAQPRIEFSGREADKFLWYGWGDPEQALRWTDGKEAAMVFALNEVRETTLRFQLWPYLVAGKHTEQRLNIGLNNHPLASYAFNENKARVLTLSVPKEMLQSKNVLTFSLPDAVSPSSINEGHNDRLLGVAVFWMEIRQPAGDGPPRAIE